MAKKYLNLIFISLFMLLWATSAYSAATSQDISAESLRILKRLEYKEGLPNGLLHAISLVETNIGQTKKYMPWPYTIRINRVSSKNLNSTDLAYDELIKLVNLGYQNFDIIIDGESTYSLSSENVQEYLAAHAEPKSIKISARSLIKYFKNKKEAQIFLDNLIERKWYNFKAGIMLLDYEVLQKKLKDKTLFLNAYENANVMLNDLKNIRRRYGWWESVGRYHSVESHKSKRYVKNVWSMYQRVHKLKVR